MRANSAIPQPPDTHKGWLARAFCASTFVIDTELQPLYSFRLVPTVFIQNGYRVSFYS